MMKLTKSTFSEVDEFMKLFHNKNFKYKIKSVNGKIVDCETNDKNIIKFLKEKGFT